MAHTHGSFNALRRRKVQSSVLTVYGFHELVRRQQSSGGGIESRQHVFDSVKTPEMARVTFQPSSGRALFLPH